jgi:hypothetical protein
MIGCAARSSSRLRLDFIGHSSVVIELDYWPPLTDPVTRGTVRAAPAGGACPPTAVADVVGWEA